MHKPEQLTNRPTDSGTVFIYEDAGVSVDQPVLARFDHPGRELKL